MKCLQCLEVLTRKTQIKFCSHSCNFLPIRERIKGTEDLIENLDTNKV